MYFYEYVLVLNVENTNSDKANMFRKNCCTFLIILFYFKMNDLQTNQQCNKYACCRKN